MDNINEGNELIAKFMGFSPKVEHYQIMEGSDMRVGWRTIDGSWVNPDGTSLNPKGDGLLYHSDWNWLMSVVEKIETTETAKGFVYVEIDGLSCKIYTTYWSEENIFALVNSGESKLKSVWMAVVKYLKTLN